MPGKNFSRNIFGFKDSPMILQAYGLDELFESGSFSTNTVWCIKILFMALVSR